MGFGLAKSTAELVTLLLVILAISMAFWLLVARFKLHNFLINTYISYAILQVLPKDVAIMGQNAQIGIFVGLIIVLTLLNDYLFGIERGRGGLAMWEVFIMSMLEVILVFSIIAAFLPQKDVLKYISKDSLGYFIDPWWKFSWMVIPLLFLIIMKKRKG